ncbi:hypothetical protein CPC08DRAFT_824701 [Agrocybe pediades]|nr:hypothetical protein CPC08DRAFT_824701 [Agrocybe pediades]
MLANSSKGKGGGKGKAKSSKANLTCNNCKKKGHSESNCFAEGGGKEKEAPEWWKKKFGKDKGTVSANVAEQSEVNHSFIAYLDTPPPPDPNRNRESPAEVHILTNPQQCPSIIIDCGATNHFTSDRQRLIEYQSITPVNIVVANGSHLSAIGKGDMLVHFPMGSGTSPTPVILRNVHYAPEMAHTLISVACIVRAHFTSHSYEDSTAYTTGQAPLPALDSMLPTHLAHTPSTNFTV